MRAVLPELKVGKEDKETGYTLGSIAIKSAIELANQVIYQTSITQPQCAGMGSTVVAGLFYNDRISIAHVGDSRMYRIRDGQISQTTKDHSFIQELVNKGYCKTLDEAVATGKKNLITRALGIGQEVLVDVHEEIVKPGDVYLLCSDGLTDMVSDETIHLTFNEFSANLNELVEKLIEVANKNGGKDNISVVLARSTKSLAKKSWYKRLLDWGS